MLEKQPSGGFDSLARRVPLTEPYTRMPLPGMAPLAPSVSVRPGSLQSRMSASVTGTGPAGRGFMMHPYSQGVYHRPDYLESMLPAFQSVQIHCCMQTKPVRLTLSLSLSL